MNTKSYRQAILRARRVVFWLLIVLSLVVAVKHAVDTGWFTHKSTDLLDFLR